LKDVLSSNSFRPRDFFDIDNGSKKIKIKDKNEIENKILTSEGSQKGNIGLSQMNSDRQTPKSILGDKTPKYN
jgi:hypothetical protein